MRRSSSTHPPLMSRVPPSGVERDLRTARPLLAFDGGTCDWGACNGEAVEWRLDAPGRRWLLVCEDLAPMGAAPTARLLVGDVREVLDTLPARSVDLVVSSPPFWNLRTYLPPTDPAGRFEIGQEESAGEFIDHLLDVTDRLARVLAPHGSIVLEMGDSSSGGGGGGHADANHGHRRDDWVAARGHRVGESPAQRLARRAHLGIGESPLAKSLCMIPQLLLHPTMSEPSAFPGLGLMASGVTLRCSTPPP